MRDATSRGVRAFEPLLAATLKGLVYTLVAIPPVIGHPPALPTPHFQRMRRAPQRTITDVNKQPHSNGRSPYLKDLHCLPPRTPMKGQTTRC